MAQKLKVTSLLCLSLLAYALFVPNVAAIGLDLGIGQDPDAKNEIDKSGLPKGNAAQQIANIIVTAIEILLSLSAILAVGAIIWGGITYTMAAANEHNAEKGKKIIFWAVIGLIITGLSFFIVQLVGRSLGIIE